MGVWVEVTLWNSEFLVAYFLCELIVLFFL